MADRDYEVGYGKPPRQYQFPKGKSGFAGRHHKPKMSLADQLDRILSEKLTVSDGGKQQRLSKEEVFLRQVIARAISGEKQSAKLMFDYLARRQDQPDQTGRDATEQFLLTELIGMLGHKEQEGRDDPA